MHADLVRSPGLWAQLEPGTPICVAEHAVFGDGELPGRIDLHAPADPPRLLQERRVDRAVRFGRHPGDDGDAGRTSHSVSSDRPASVVW